MDINKVTLIGRLTHKPEERATQAGQRLASFSVATNYMWRDSKSKEKKDKTDFHRVVAWGKLAEIALAYLDKGSRVYCEGRLQYSQWRDKNDQAHKSADIVADELILLGDGNNARRGSDGQDRKPMLAEEQNELVVEEV